MNDEQHAYWEAYILECAYLFGLRDWRLSLDREYVKGGGVAECRVWSNQKGATITLTDWFMKNYTPEEQRETIAHELFHCHDYRLRCLIHEYVDADQGKFFLGLFEREYEQLCDAVSYPFSLLLPLPENAPNPLPSTNKP